MINMIDMCVSWHLKNVDTPTDRTKTEEEIALEEKEKLKKLEVGFFEF